MASRPKTSNFDPNLLIDLIGQVKLVNVKLDLLIEINGGKKKPVSAAKLTPDAMSLLSLPMSLRKTAMVLYKLDRATAEDLAKETGRLRAVESSSANQLVRMGYLNKKRDGRDTYFFIDTPTEPEK
jgi:hypothetical protein